MPKRGYKQTKEHKKKNIETTIKYYTTPEGKETKKKLLEINKGRVPWNKGMKNCFSKEYIENCKKRPPNRLGKKHSEETKDKISQARKGFKVTKETKKKLRNFRGKKHHAWMGGYKERYKRRKKNLKYRLCHNISSSIARSLGLGAKNGGHWEDLVGYNVKQLKKHLEKQFDKNMNWDNYGSYWHVDHIIPISVFDFNIPEHINFHRCWGLSNLRPLERIENIKKSNKIIKPFQIGLKI